MIEAADSNNNCHYVTVPQGTLPSDVLISSPIIHGGNDGGGSVAGGGGGGSSFAEYGGIDPSMDPELALALRVSMEEERARQEATQKPKGGETATEEATPAPSEPKAAQSAMVGSEDDELQRALQLSMQEAAAATETTTTSSETKEAPPPAPASGEAASDAKAAAFLDPSFVNNLLTGLPGVDPNDPKIQAAMAQLNKSGAKKDGNKKDDDEKKK